MIKTDEEEVNKYCIKYKNEKAEKKNRVGLKATCQIKNIVPRDLLF